MHPHSLGSSPCPLSSRVLTVPFVHSLSSLSGLSEGFLAAGFKMDWGNCLILHPWFFLGLTSWEGQLVVTGDADSQHQA